MATVLLTKRIEFSASHRYYNAAWSAARNREVFGACSNASGHGHNYLLEVTVEGEISEETGMVVNLYDLKQVLKTVLLEFDHKHLNLDTPYFTTAIPTTENIAGVLWSILTAYMKIGRLQSIRLFEEEDLYAEVTAESFTKDGRLAQARLTRRYHFPAAHRIEKSESADDGQTALPRTCGGADLHGHNYALQVTIGGPVNPETGMVTDLVLLDRAVQQRVIERFGYRNLNMDPELAGRPTGMNMARFIWMLLRESIPEGKLVKVGLTETVDTSYEYEGALLIR